MTEVKKQEVKKGTQAIFETRDILLASYLKLKGYILKSVVLNSGGDRVIFGFFDKQDAKEREQDVLDFYNDINGYLNYANCWKDLKSAIHNYKK